MPRNCTIIGNCVDCPAIPPTPSQGAQVVVSNGFSWSAGANSIDVLDGSVRTIFSVTPPVMGLLIGFKSERSFVTSPSRLLYGFYLTSVAGLPFFSVIESGVQKAGNSRWYSGSDVFTISRAGSVVLYRFNDAVVYASETRSFGPLRVNACLFGVGDTVQ